MTKNEFIEKYIDIPEESCDYIPWKKEMESDLNTLIETLLTEYQALQLQQTGVIKSVCLLGYSFEGCKYTEPKHEACKYCDKFNQTVL